MFKNTIGQYGYKANHSTRDEKTAGGGIVIITNEQWGKIPTKRATYNPPEREMKGRTMAVTFDNKIAGAHNKLQIIAVHGTNGAHQQEDRAIKQLQWIQQQKEKFEQNAPMATTIIVGDMNAAESTNLDTDRGEKEKRTIGEHEREKDEFVIKTIRNMKWHILKEKYLKPEEIKEERITKQVFLKLL